MPVITGKVGAGMGDENMANGTIPRSESDLLDTNDVGGGSLQTISKIESAPADDLLGLIGGSPKQTPTSKPVAPQPSNDILGLLEFDVPPASITPTGKTSDQFYYGK